MLKNIIFLVLLIVSVSCANKVGSSKNSVGQITNYSEDISHLIPQFNKGNEDKEEKQTEETDNKTANVIIEDDNQKVNTALAKIIENNKNFNNGQGFRIQVFSSNSRSEFENAKSFLLRNYPQLEVYESYSQPTYRIKVGDFIYYQDAEKFSSSLKQRFGTIRIINDKINIKKALNIK